MPPWEPSTAAVAELTRNEVLRRAAAADHGVLSSVHPTRGVDAVPVCFVIDGDLVAVPIDRVKAKASTTLGRVRNLDADPRASLLCEHWDGLDWSRLWWVRLTLVRVTVSPDAAARAASLLRARYPQYAAAPFESILTFRIRETAGWSADEAAG